MGWNTWNTFGEDISEDLIIETCDAMIEKGLRDAGYTYIVIDDCWSCRERDAEGGRESRCGAILSLPTDTLPLFRTRWA